MCEGIEKINIMVLHSNEQKFLQTEMHDHISFKTNV